MLGDEASGCQIEDKATIEFFVEGKVEVVQGFLRVTELSLFLAALQQSIATAGEFISCGQARGQARGQA
jgi:hypothetical protein